MNGHGACFGTVEIWETGAAVQARVFGLFLAADGAAVGRGFGWWRYCSRIKETPCVFVDERFIEVVVAEVLVPLVVRDGKRDWFVVGSTNNPVVGMAGVFAFFDYTDDGEKATPTWVKSICCDFEAVPQALQGLKGLFCEGDSVFAKAV